MITEDISTFSDIIEGIEENQPNAELTYKDEDILVVDNISFLNTPDNVFIKMNGVVACRKGRMEASTLDGTISLSENEIFVCRPNQLINNIMVSPDFECAILCITNNGLRNILGNYMQLWTKTVIVDKINKTKLDEQGMAYFYHFYSLLEMCMHAENERFTAWHPFRRDIVQQAIKFGLLGLCNNLAMMAENDLPTKANTDNGFARFMDLLQNTTMKHQPVDYYAEKLCITSKYLTVLCKKFSNKTAQDWIREYTLTDITYYLRNTSLPIKEIAAKIGFPNTSFFGKYVKTYLGMTPRQYRDQLPTEQG